jgi:hypothetical protein
MDGHGLGCVLELIEQSHAQRPPELQMHLLYCYFPVEDPAELQLKSTIVHGGFLNSAHHMCLHRLTGFSFFSIVLLHQLK